jgi:hypothetical protein
VDLYGELKDIGYLWLWAMVAMICLIWVISEIKETAFQNGYWKGRADGWQSHRRMTNIKKESDKVFDYDKQN